MSDRPKWMPETGTVALLHLASEELREQLFRETGLRAQIAVLESLFEDLYEVNKETMMATVCELRKELGE